MMAQIVKSLALKWETWIEFLNLSFGCAKSWLLGASGDKISEWELFFFLCLLNK